VIVALSLMELDPTCSEECLSAIRPALDDRRNAARAIYLLGDASEMFSIESRKAIVPVLMSALNAKRQSARKDVAQALGRMGDIADAAIPPLEQLAENAESLQVRSASQGGACSHQNQRRIGTERLHTSSKTESVMRIPQSTQQQMGSIRMLMKRATDLRRRSV
jgi:HEAT repeat protein